MSNWGSALGGFATGFQTGYSTTASAIDRYERRQAEKELRDALKAADLERQNALKDTPEVEGLKDAAPDKFTILENETGKKTAIDLDKVGKDEPVSREQLEAFAKAQQKSSASKSQPSAIGNTGNINFNDPRIARYFSQDKPAPVEDRSTPIQPKTATRSKQPRAITPVQSKAPTKANIAKQRQAKSTPRSTLGYQSSGDAYMPPPTEEGAMKLKARELGLTGTHERFANEEAQARARRPDPMASTISRTSPEARPASADLKRYGAEAASRTKATPTMWSELSRGAAPGDNIRDPGAYRRMALGGTTPVGGTETRFAPEEDIAARRRAFAMTPEESQARVASGQMEDVYARQQAEAMTPEEAQARAASGQMESVYAGQQAGQPSALNGGAAQQPSQPSQPSALNGGASGARQGITAYDILTPEQRRFEADRLYNNRVRQAELQYLLKTDPAKGLQVAKQYVVEDARQEFSDNVRRAMSGDPEGIKYFLPYANVITGRNLQLGEDGRTLYELDANGQPVPTDLNVGQLQSILGQSYMIHMMSAGMAFDKILPMMTALNKENREERALNIKQQDSDSLRQYRAGRVAAGVAAGGKMNLKETTDSDGNPVFVNQNTGQIYDPDTNVQLPPGTTKRTMIELKEAYGDDTRLAQLDDGSYVLMTPDGEMLDLRTGELVNPNVSDTSKQPRRALSFSDDGVGLIKGLEGYSATPYSDYTQSSIGYGTKALPGDTRITEQEAEQRLRDYVAQNIEPQLNEALGDTLVTQKEYDALVSLAYNVGTPTLLRSRAFQLLKEGDREGFRREVADRERGFTKTRGVDGQLVVNPGLLARREKEMDYFFG